MLKEKIVTFIESKDMSHLEQKKRQKKNLQRSVPHKQSDHKELSIQIEKLKYGLE